MSTIYVFICITNLQPQASVRKVHGGDSQVHRNVRCIPFRSKIDYVELFLDCQSPYSFAPDNCKMRRRRISLEDKKRLVRAHTNGEDYVQVADTLGINRSSARSILSKALKLDDPEELEEKRRGGPHNIKVDDQMKAAMSEILDRNPTITMKKLNQELRRQLPQKPLICDSHVGRICSGMLYTVKKNTAAPADR